MPAEAFQDDAVIWACCDRDKVGDCARDGAERFIDASVREIQKCVIERPTHVVCRVSGVGHPDAVADREQGGVHLGDPVAGYVPAGLYAVECSMVGVCQDLLNVVPSLL